MKKYGTQPLDLMQFINTKYHEPFIHEWIVFEKKLEEERFAAALDTLAEVFPLLKCHYDSGENMFVEQDIRGRDLLRITEEGSKEPYLTESLDMNSRLIRFTLAENVLYITVSHLMCDGSGFKQLIYLLCEIYNGTFEGSAPYLMRREFSQLENGRAGKGGTIQMLLSMLGNYKNRSVYGRSAAEEAYVLERVLPRDTMEKIHRQAKEQGATLNDVFLTAYARALGRRCGFSKVNIPCTVDLRKYAAEKTRIANLTGTYNLNIKLKAGEPFRADLLSASAAMKRQKATQNDLAGPRLLVSKYEKSTLEKFVRTYGSMNTGAFTDYTNLGILDETRLVFRGTEAVHAVGYSGLSKAPCFQLAVSTFRGETTVSSLIQCGKTEKEKADLLMETIVSELETYARPSV